MIVDIGIFFVIIFFVFCIGFASGRISKQSKPHGVIRISENKKGGLLYSLELTQDPELLTTQKEVKFKVDASSYQKVHSQV